MASLMRFHIAKQMRSVIRRMQPLSHVDIDKLAWCVRFPVVSSMRNTPENRIDFLLSTKALVQSGILPYNQCQDMADLAAEEFDNLKRKETNGDIKASVDFEQYKKAVLQEIYKQKDKYASNSILYRYKYNKQQQCVDTCKANETVVIDFSSPNIAKPFHAGHIRSTLIGNFLANLNEHLGHKVIRINYLGDWGTQFGLLGVALKNSKQLPVDPQERMKYLFKAYVSINEEVALTPDTKSDKRLNDVYQEALQFFNRLEQGEEEAVNLWKALREFTIIEYKKIYDKLHIRFDIYQGESMYWKSAKEVVTKLLDKGWATTDSSTGVVVMEFPAESKTRRAELLKSDGTTLYLTRDIAAALDRYNTYKFDRLHYVVGLSQHAHFKQLHQILKKLDIPWANSCNLDDLHITFGSVKNMSTRQGKVLLLQTILDECQEVTAARMNAQAHQKRSAVSCISDEQQLQHIIREMSTSVITCLELQIPRNKSYDYKTTNWEAMLRPSHKGGFSFQYTRSRIYSLETRFSVPAFEDCDVSLLREHEVIKLIAHLMIFDESLYRSFFTYEAVHVYNYVVELCKYFNESYRSLPVLGADVEVAKARMLLFHCTRLVLDQGLRLLGMIPLDKT